MNYKIQVKDEKAQHRRVIAKIDDSFIKLIGEGLKITSPIVAGKKIVLEYKVKEGIPIIEFTVELEVKIETIEAIVFFAQDLIKTIKFNSKETES